MTATDLLQFFLAMTIFVSLFVQRFVSGRFSSNNRVCSGDVVTTKIGQVGLSISAIASFALGMEALGWFQAGYKAIIMVLLLGEALIGVRMIYSAHLVRLTSRRALQAAGKA